MPIYMDRHYIKGATRHAVENAHKKDLEIQDKYGVKFKTYWFDEEHGTAFCLVDAPNIKAIQYLHNEAHGLVPNEIIEVDPTAVEAFLGRIKDPIQTKIEKAKNEALIDSAFRSIMFTDLKDFTEITTQLGEEKAMNLLHIHNSLIRNMIIDYHGREVKHTGDGFMISFASVSDAVMCAIAIQKAFDNYNEEEPQKEMHVRIGISAGEPVEEDGDLFGTTVQLASRLCNYAEPDKILISEIVQDKCEDNKFLISDLGKVNLKGFNKSVELYEVNW